MTRILVLGATGLLGQAMTFVLGGDPSLQVMAARRDGANRQGTLSATPIACADLTEIAALERLLAEAGPDVVINCVAASRQQWNDWPAMVGLFATLPRRLALFSERMAFRLIHIGTDGVFSGTAGGYRETDIPDAQDLYGTVKQLGDVAGPGVTTIRTSIIGPDPLHRRGLLEWALQQSGPCKGFSLAFFSGLPTFELARIIRDEIIPRPSLEGIYHVASEKISKADLVRLIASKYGRAIAVEDDPSVQMDRSLNADKFAASTGYRPRAWNDLIDELHLQHRQYAGDHV